MTQPVQIPFLLRTAFYASAATALTGCSTETTAVAAFMGVTALGVGAWSGFRYLTRLRETSSAPTSTAAVLSQPTPPPAKETKRPFRITFRVDVEKLDRVLHLPTATASQLETALEILCRQGLGHSDEEIVQAAGATLHTAVSLRRELVTHKLVGLLNDLLERKTGATTGIWCCQLLHQIASSLHDKPVAVHAMDSLSFAGVSHASDEVAQKAASVFSDLAEHGGRNEGAAKLILPEAVERLSTAGLKSGRNRFVARKCLEALKTLSLLKGNPPAAIQAFDALSMDGLLHADPEVAVMASEKITEIADKDHSRVTMLPLVSLRSIGLRPQAPRELTLAFLETMAHIAAPQDSSPGPDRKTSEKALQLLFDDGLTHSTPDIAEIARRHLRAIYLRRPDLFTEDQRETLATHSPQAS